MRTTPKKTTDRRLQRLALALAWICIGAAHGSLIGYKVFANVDESYALALAERMLEGQKLYVGAISQRGPLMYYAYELIARVGGWDNIVNLRLFALGFALLHVTLVYVAASRLFGARATIFATLLSAYSLALGIPAFDRFALNGEFLQTPALLVAVLLPAIALRPAGLGRAPMATGKRRAVLAAAGLVLGAAISVKQTVTPHLVPVLLWILVRALRGHRRGALLDAVTFTLASVILPLAFVLHAWSTGTLDALVYYTLRYNLVVHVGESASFFSSFSAAARELTANYTFGITVVIICGLGATRAFSIASRCLREKSARPFYRAFGPDTFLALQIAIALATAAALRRFFPHYFIPSLPLMALALGRAAARATRDLPAGRVKKAVVIAMSALVLMSGVETYQLEKVDGHVAHDKHVERLARYIETTTAPSDRVFVWGFSPWLYEYSHRRPAGRFVFETYVTGFVPWFHEDLDIERRRVVPGSMSALIGDLEREQPVLVVDAGVVMMARSMRTYEEPAAFLHAHYCFEVRVQGFDLYRRKPDLAVCPSPFPHPQGAFDYFGRTIPVPVPKTIDAAESAWLYGADPAVPAWFKGAPRPAHVEMLVEPSNLKHGMRLEGADLP